MEESPAEPEERPNGEAGRPPDASPWGVGRDVMVYPMTSPWWVGKTKKGGEREPRPVCPAALAATPDHKKAPKKKQKT